jgi:hypothetical protein
MNTHGGVVTVTLKAIDVSKYTKIQVGFWLRRGGSFSEPPDSGEDLVIEYLNSQSSWVNLDTFYGSGTSGQIYANNLYNLSGNALHSGFRIRYRQTGASGVNFDYYHIDDVFVGRVIAYDHDVEVEKINVPSEGAMAKNVIINTTIRNQGLKNETNITIQLRIDNSTVNSSNITRLNSTERAYLLFNWLPMKEGIFNVSIHALPVNGENYTQNNQLNNTINITARPEIHVNPLFFNLSAFSGESVNRSILIGNNGTSNLSYEIFESGNASSITICTNGASSSMDDNIWNALTNLNYSFTSSGSGCPTSGYDLIIVCQDGGNALPDFSNHLNNGGHVMVFGGSGRSAFTTSLGNYLKTDGTSSWHTSTTQPNWLTLGNHPITCYVPSSYNFYLSSHTYHMTHLLGSSSQPTGVTIIGRNSEPNYICGVREYQSGGTFTWMGLDINWRIDSSDQTNFVQPFLKGYMEWVGKGDLEWISVSPQNGTVQKANQTIINLIANASLLDPGFYYTNLRIKSNDPNHPWIWIRVNFTVFPAPHDLRLTQLSTPKQAIAGRAIFVNATILNQGTNNETNITIQLLVDGMLMNSTNVSMLNRTEQTNITLSWTPMAGKTYNVTIKIIPVTGEKQTNNNILNRSIFVYEIPDIRIDPREFNISVMSGKISNYNLTIGNDDLGNLSYQFFAGNSYRKMLVYSQYADLSASGEFYNTLKAIDQVTKEYDYSILNDYTQLNYSLDGIDILLIPEQELGNFGVMDTIGRTWKTRLWEFLNASGTIIVCDCTGFAYQILHAAGLMSITGTSVITGNTVSVLNAKSPITRNINTTFTAPEGAINYTTSENQVICAQNNAPVVISKRINNGSVTLIGFDYNMLNNPDANKIIGNSVKYYGTEVGSYRWLSVLPDNGTLSRFKQVNHTISINTTFLNPGFYKNYFSISSNDPDEGSIFVPVNLTVTPAVHDIRVFDLDIPKSGVAGTNCMVNATIINQGISNETNITIQLKINGTIVNSTKILALKAGNSTIISLSWFPTVENVYNAEIYAVPIPNETQAFNNNMNDSFDITAYSKIWISNNSYNWTMAAGRLSIKNLTIGNSGYGNLNFQHYIGVVGVNGKSITTNGDIDDIIVYSSTPILNKTIFDYIYIYAFTSDYDTLFVSVSGFNGNGTGWEIIYTGTGGRRAVVDGYYAAKNYSKLRIFMDDTEGNDLINYTYTYTIGEPCDWLDITPSSGSILPFNQTEFKLSVNTTKLNPGFYSTRIFINSNDPQYDWVIIPVNLTVTPAPHDIRVLKLSAPTSSEAGNKIYINATILNQGASNETNITIQLKIDGVVENSTKISILNITSIQNITFIWIPTLEKTYQLEIFAVPVQNEIVVMNNQQNSSIFINADSLIDVAPNDFNFILGLKETAAKKMKILNNGYGILDYQIGILLGLESGQSGTTQGNIDQILYWDHDLDSNYDIYDEIYIYAYSGDNDTLDVTVSGYDGSTWTTIYSGTNGGSRVVVDGRYASKSYRRIRIQLDDTENNDDIYFTYRFTFLGGNSGWLTVSPTSGSVGQINFTLVNLFVNTSNLSLGFYWTTLTIISNDPNNGIIKVRVNLTIVKAYNLSLTPGYLSEYGSPNEVLWFNLTIFNHGLRNDTIKLNATGTSWDTRFYDSSGLTQIKNVSIAPGKNKSIVVKITVPWDAPPGVKQYVNINISSLNASAITFDNATILVKTQFRIPWFDDFDDGFLTENWTVTSSGGIGGVNSYTSKSGFYSMYLNAGPVSISTVPIITSGCKRIQISFWVRHGGPFSEPPDTGEDLIAEYLNINDGWTKLETFYGGAIGGTIYDRSYNITDDLFGKIIQLRFRMTAGSGGTSDFWHIDDVSLGFPPPVNLTVKGYDTSFTQIYQGNYDITMLDLTFKAKNSSIEINTITLNLTGTGTDTDISEVRLALDVDKGGVYSTSDIQLCSGKFDSGKITFSGAWVVPDADYITIFVLYNISDYANVGNTVGVRVTHGDVTACSPANICYFPTIQSTNLRILEKSDMLYVSSSNLAPQYSEQDQSNVPVMNLTFTANSRNITVTSIRFDFYGDGDDKDVEEVRFFIDNDLDNEFDEEIDELIGEKKFLYNELKFDGLLLTVQEGSPISLVITFDIDLKATAGNRVGVWMSGSDIDVISPDVVLSGVNYGGQITITKKRDREPPKVPNNLGVRSFSFDSIKLSWTPNTDVDLVGYMLYRTQSSDPISWGDPVAIIENSESEFNDTGLKELTTYYYVLTSFDEVPNESDYSNQVTATTTFGPRSPVVVDPIEDFEIVEDGYDDATINLYDVFSDENDDHLTFKCRGQKYIQVKIFPDNGTVTLKPDKDWNGEETLTFYCSDGQWEVIDKVIITVTPVNDPPINVEILIPAHGTMVKEDERLDFKGRCFDADIQFGDKLRYIWSSNISGKIGDKNLLLNLILTPGIHRITLEISDLAGETAWAETEIIIQAVIKPDVDPDVGPPDDQIDHGNGSDGGGESDKPMSQFSLFLTLILMMVIIIIIAIVVLFIVLKRKKEYLQDKDVSNKSKDKPDARELLEIESDSEHLPKPDAVIKAQLYDGTQVVLSDDGTAINAGISSGRKVEHEFVIPSSTYGPGRKPPDQNRPVGRLPPSNYSYQQNPGQPYGQGQQQNQPQYQNPYQQQNQYPNQYSGQTFGYTPDTPGTPGHGNAPGTGYTQAQGYGQGQPMLPPIADQNKRKNKYF